MSEQTTPVNEQLPFTSSVSTPVIHRESKQKKKRTSAKGKVRLDTRPQSGGLAFQRRWTAEGKDPLQQVRMRRVSSAIRDTDGHSVFEMKNVEVPESWSQLAVDILVSKYFRKAGVPQTGSETGVSQVIQRITKTIRDAGEAAGYFDSKLSAQIFEDELTHLLVHQMGAFNSPVWFNLGLWHAYGIEGTGGNYHWNAQTQTIEKTQNAYQYPQCSACFIQGVQDDLMGIFDLAKNEARLFKYGSGTGSNFSALRGKQEKLAGGGLSSGLMSFLEVLDRGAGATKSGGTTRRAAKMVCLDMDHPEIMDFITWKKREEKKVKALIDAGYSGDFNGDAYRTVSGQNSNNSVRVTDAFMKAVEADETWETRARTTGEVVESLKARDLWKEIADSAWACADPGVQYDTTINDWHTCPNTDRIRASNPCSEYMFLDNTACNLASLNLVKFLKKDGSFDIDAYQEACRVFIVAQEILVGLSSYPTAEIAQNSHDYRPLGLGYANLGTLLMIQGIPYDSDAGRAWAGALTAIMTGTAYAASAEEAAHMGAFAGFSKNREPMLRVIRKHRDAAYALPSDGVPEALVQAAHSAWDQALEQGEQWGYRNSQVSVLAPTGTIGLLMDCDTTGIEPDFALVKFKKLAGGGSFKIVNQSVPRALKNLGYTQTEIEDILQYVLGRLSFSDAPGVSRAFLKQKGLEDAEIDHLEARLAGVFDLSGVFNRFSVGDETLKRLGFSESEFSKPGFNLLRAWGVASGDIALANEWICGTMTVEGAPHLKVEHLPVFDCANKCGAKGQRFIAPMGHIRMMAAAQPFLSGAISKTVNLPHETTVEEIESIYMESWKSGLKAVALYRDGSKHSQPLSTKTDAEEAKAETKAKEILEQAHAEAERILAKARAASGAAPAQVTFAPVKRQLPYKRTGFTQESTIGGHKVYLRTGEFEDGSLGEIFVDMHKEGAAYRALMNCFAISVSMGLKYGVPLSEFVDKFTFVRFDPSGFVEGHPNIKMATSVVDYIFRVLGLEYLGRTDFVQVKPKPQDQATHKPSAILATGGDLPGMERQGTLPIAATTNVEVAEASSSSSDYLAEMMGDAPPCDQCGHTTVRNGSCYRCLNCGSSMGCS